MIRVIRVRSPLVTDKHPAWFDGAPHSRPKLFDHHQADKYPIQQYETIPDPAPKPGTVLLLVQASDETIAALRGDKEYEVIEGEP